MNSFLYLRVYLSQYIRRFPHHNTEAISEFLLKVCSGSLKTVMDWSICFLFLPLGTIFALTPRYLSTQVLQRLSLESESSICQKRKIPSSSYQPIVIVESRLQYLWWNVTKPLFFSNLFFQSETMKYISRSSETYPKGSDSWDGMWPTHVEGTNQGPWSSLPHAVQSIRLREMVERGSEIQMQW